VTQGLHLGQVLDEHRVDFGPGDFAIRAVTAVDRSARSIVVADPIAVGATVQFQVRDAAAADQALRAALAGRSGAGALVLAGSGRGVRLFGEPDHDAEVVSAVVDRGAGAGVFCTSVARGRGGVDVDDPTAALVVLLHDR
jgi:small ligand-binding sensory domain FIST